MKELIDEKDDGIIKKVFKSNYNDLIKKHKDSSKDGKWTDPDFPPEQSSIGDEDMPRASWKRIPSVIKNPEFISGKIEPSEVLQGSIGDCYFLSSIAALAEEDHRIKNLFPNLEIKRLVKRIY